MKSLEYLPSLDDVLYHLIPNLAAHWKDELTYPQQKYIYPSDPKDPLEWGPDLAFSIYARWYLREIDEELANFILQSDETEIISPDLIELLEKRREGEEEEEGRGVSVRKVQLAFAHRLTPETMSALSSSSGGEVASGSTSGKPVSAG